MMQVSNRVERTTVSDITNVRKTLIAEHSGSSTQRQGTVKAKQKQVHDVPKQVKELKQPANTSRTTIKPNDAPRTVSGKELSEAEPAPAAKPRDPSATNGKAAHGRATGATQDNTAPSTVQLPSKCRLPERVAIIGAGPVGCLTALAFAQRGCKVDVFESRPDPRTHEAVARASQRSINLALSTRGITGLRSVSLAGLGKYAYTGKDLADLVLQDSVPMRARMIHVVTKRATDGKQAQVKELSQLYSTKGESINSVDRGRLNNILLDHALMHPNVNVHFEHKLQSVDFDHDSTIAAKRAASPAVNGVADAANMSICGNNTTGGENSAVGLTYRSGKGNAASQSASSSAVDRVRLDFDLHSTNQHIPKTSNTHLVSFVVGCDGAHSSIRSAMGSLIRMHYTHNYIDTGYVELSIPPRTSLFGFPRPRFRRSRRQARRTRRFPSRPQSSPHLATTLVYAHRTTQLGR